MLWTWFEEDAILEKIMHQPRVHSDSDGYFLHPYQWDLLIERISLEYEKKLRDEGLRREHDDPDRVQPGHASTAATHRPSGHLSAAILDKACILYIDVPYEESLRKNRRRFNPERPGLDPGARPAGRQAGAPVQGSGLGGLQGERSRASSRFPAARIPYAVFDNMPEKTDKPEVLGAHLEEVLNRLWALPAGGRGREPAFPKPAQHSRAFRRRRFLNWFPLGLTYATMYMGRYNFNVVKNDIGALYHLDKAQMGLIATFGFWTYGLAS